MPPVVSKADGRFLLSALAAISGCDVLLFYGLIAVFYRPASSQKIWYQSITYSKFLKELRDALLLYSLISLSGQSMISRILTQINNTINRPAGHVHWGGLEWGFRSSRDFLHQFDIKRYLQ